MFTPTDPSEAAVLEALARTLEASRSRNSHIPPVGRVIGCLEQLAIAQAPDVETRAQFIEAIVCSALAAGVTEAELERAARRYRQHEAGASSIARIGDAGKVGA